MKTLVFLKTHFINDFLINELQKMRVCDTKNHKTILFIDNHDNILDSADNTKKILKFGGKKQECFIFDEAIFKETNLPYYTDETNNIFFTRLMWYCCDYPFYIIRQYYPDYDYYWQIESDVYFNGENYKPFFQKFKDDDSDLLMTNYIEIDIKKKYQKPDISDKWIYPKQKKASGLFPVVRLSAKAVDLCYKRRIEHMKKFEKAKDNSINKWVYCERFIATECRLNGLKCSSLKEYYIRFLPPYNLEKDIPEPDNKMYHPVKIIKEG